MPNINPYSRNISIPLTDKEINDVVAPFKILLQKKIAYGKAKDFKQEIISIIEREKEKLEATVKKLENGLHTGD